VKVVGFDADPDQITALKQGTVQALIAQSAVHDRDRRRGPGGRGAVGQGDHPEDRTKFTIITSANLNSAASQAAIYKTSC